MTPTVYPAMLPPKVMVNGFSTNGWTRLPPCPSPVQGLPNVSSGALTAGVLAQVLNVTGPGVLEYLSVINKDATSRTLRIKLVIDGVTVLDATSAALTAVGTACLVGAVSWTSGASPIAVALGAIPFRTSCVLYVASSLTEAAPFTIQYVYRGV